MSSKILIVEDEADIGRLLYMQIESMGYQAQHVTSGEEALSLMNKQEYDLLLLDWMLPGMSGVEITELIRKMDSMRDVAILMLTAKSEPEDIVQGLEAGADDYITKPFQSPVLKARIESLLRRVKRQAAIQPESTEPVD